MGAGNKISNNFLYIFQKLNLIKGKVISINIGIPGKYFK